MTIPTLPPFASYLTQPVTANNFIAIQSAQLAVTQTSSSITFTALPGVQRLTAKITKYAIFDQRNPKNLLAACQKIQVAYFWHAHAFGCFCLWRRRFALFVQTIYK